MNYFKVATAGPFSCLQKNFITFSYNNNNFKNKICQVICSNSTKYTIETTIGRECVKLFRRQYWHWYSPAQLMVETLIPLTANTHQAQTKAAAKKKATKKEEGRNMGKAKKGSNSQDRKQQVYKIKYSCVQAEKVKLTLYDLNLSRTAAVAEVNISCHDLKPWQKRVCYEFGSVSKVA